MNGQLNEQPLAELIREISLKSLGGRLRLAHDRIKVAAYFHEGKFVYAACNVRTFRLREYLQKAGLVSEEQFTRFDERISDIELANRLSAEKLLTAAAAEQVQTRQVSDILRLALLWTDGTWEFDYRSNLNEAPGFKIDPGPLLLEAARRMPAKFVASRFRNLGELISPVAAPPSCDNLLPTEVFLLSRLDKPMALSELISVSGLPRSEALGLIYTLAVGGLVDREHWKNVFRSQPPSAAKTEESTTQAQTKEEQPREATSGAENVDTFLERLRNVGSHYEVLGVDRYASSAQLKAAYYELARRYHPDRFRRAEPSLLARIESAFARITQAYDILRDDNLRATYNSKLESLKRAQQLADSAPKAAAPAAPPPDSVDITPEPTLSAAERAENDFKEGFAALESGQRGVATGLFASASRLQPNEPRYRAFYGQMLAAQERTRRAAEAELQAAIKLDPANADYRVMLAELYRDLGFTLRARGEAERALAADANNRKARDLLRELKSV
jgi:curved DNA-binding protein CbpA